MEDIFVEYTRIREHLVRGMIRRKAVELFLEKWDKRYCPEQGVSFCMMLDEFTHVIYGEGNEEGYGAIDNWLSVEAPGCKLKDIEYFDSHIEGTDIYFTFTAEDPERLKHFLKKYASQITTLRYRSSLEEDDNFGITEEETDTSEKETKSNN